MLSSCKEGKGAEVALQVRPETADLAGPEVPGAEGGGAVKDTDTESLDSLFVGWLLNVPVTG